MYDGLYVFDFIAHCWATFRALRALLFSHIMTNKDDDDLSETEQEKSPLRIEKVNKFSILVFFTGNCQSWTLKIASE